MEFILAANREPKAPETLHKWIKALLGFHVPTEAPTEGQTSPFQFVSDAFFGEFERGLVLATRGGAKTRNAAVLNLLVSKFRPGTHTVHFGAIGKQGAWGHEYLRDMVRPHHMSDDVIKSERGIVLWRNGSWVRPATGRTDTGVTAIRANRGTWDEVDLWMMDLFEMSQMMVQGTVANPAQRIYISTQYTAYGLMGQLIREAELRGLQCYKWDVWASMQRCERCLEQDCPLFIWENPKSGDVEPLCKGRGLRADGYVPRQAVVDEFFAMKGGDEWAVEKLLEEPTREYRVIPTFDEKKHTGDAPEEAFTDSALKACGVDWGFDHPCVFTVFAEVGDRLWGIYEHGERFTTSGQRLEIAKELQRQYGPELVFYCDASEPDEIRLFCEHDLIAVACPVRNREARHRAIRRMLRYDPVWEGSRLMFDKKRMPSTIWQFATVHRDEKTGKEVLEGNDYFDASEYCLSAIDFSGGIAAGGAFMATLTLLLFSIILILI